MDICGADESASKSLHCPDCGKNFSRKFRLDTHKKFYCPKTKGIDHLTSSKRRDEALPRPGYPQGWVPTQQEIAKRESRSVTYREDKEMDSFLLSIPSAYTRFRLCENPRNPQAVAGFWPPLFDYRGQAALAEVVQSLNVDDAYKTLASILTDAYTYHNVTSISFKKIAFLETENGVFYDLSRYRVPRSHCTVNEGSKIRRDQPRFKIAEEEYEVRVSLHERFLELLPPPLPQCLSDGQGYDDDCELMEQEDEEEEDAASIHLDELFDEETLSQQFDSQASIFEDSPGVLESPPNKRMKLSTTSSQSTTEAAAAPPMTSTTTATGAATTTAAPSSITTVEPKKMCHLCGVYVGGDKRNIAQHIRKSCPKNPDVDALEAARRQKKAEKLSKKVQSCLKEVPKKEEGDSGGDENGDGDCEVTRHVRGGDCGCRGAEHGQECSRSPIFQHGHRRLPRNIPAPHFNPDPDTLAPHLLRPIIPMIQAINQRKLTNRQNRYIAGLGQPRNGIHFNNNLWPRVVSKVQLPFMFSDTVFTDLFYLNKQQMYQLRNSIIYPMLAQRGAQAQGPRGARSSLPHTLTPDSLACLFMLKVRLGQTDRVVAAELGIDPKSARKWVRIMRNYYFTTDTFIQRNLNLGIQANMQALLRQGIDATARCQRTSTLYGHLCRPGTELLVVVIDSRAVKIQQSSDAFLQKRTISTKIHDNSVQKMTISDASGLPMVTFPLMCSISPSGTDESNCEHLITLHQAGVPGGLCAFLESPLTEQVTLVLLEDQGFRRYGFDHAIRRSFIDYQDDLQRRTNGGFRYFTPCFPSDIYRDRNFAPVGRYGQLPGGSRHRCRTANTSSACCTRTRWLVESLFARESHLSLLGARSEVPNQYLNPCGIPNYGSQTTLMVWLQIGDSLIYHHATPYSYKYGTVDTYLDHANDMKRRMELENPLSSLSGVQWSRNNIFSRPLGLHPRTLNGRPITQVNLLDQQQTGLPPVTPDELSSVTLGSYQQRLVRSYVTSLR